MKELDGEKPLFSCYALSVFVCLENIQVTFACPTALGRKAPESSVSLRREGSSWEKADLAN